jgi:Spy/CpxP family protein refolding chaperone
LQGKYSSLLIAVALLAGLAVGFAGSTLAYRYRLLNVPGEWPMERMARELQLTPAQHDQVEEVMESTRDKIQQARRDFRHQRRQILIDAYTRIRALLTPDQQKQFDRNFVPSRIRAEAEQGERQGGAPSPPRIRTEAEQGERQGGAPSPPPTP